MCEYARAAGQTKFGHQWTADLGPRRLLVKENIHSKLLATAILIVAAATSLTCQGVAGQAADSTREAGNALRLWYRQPAAKWSESLFIGNGRLGGAVWGGVPRERIDLNEDTLWSGEPYENINTNGRPALPEIRRLLLAGRELEAQALVERNLLGRYNENYLALGNLQLDFPPIADPANYLRELDLQRAVVRESYEAGGVKYVREIFASQPAQAIVVRLTASARGKLSFTASLNSQLHHTNSAGKDFHRLAGICPCYSDCYRKRTNYYDPGPNPKGMIFEARMTAQAEGGKIGYTDAGVVAENCDAVTLLLVAATSFNGPHKSPSRQGRNPALECAHYESQMAGRSYARLLREHVADYQKLFQRVTIDLGHNALGGGESDRRTNQDLSARRRSRFGRAVLSVRPLSADFLVTPRHASRRICKASGIIHFFRRGRRTGR